MTDREKLARAIDSVANSRQLIDRSDLSTIIAAARAHLEKLPKPPRAIETWHVEWVALDDEGDWELCVETFATRERAEAALAELQGNADLNSGYGSARAEALRQCARVTGPHQHLVPA